MLHNNNTPFAALAFDQWHPNGSTMAVISARARIKVAPDGSQVYDPDVELVLADTFVDDPHKSPMLQVNDLIPYKPAADVTIKGALHAAEPSERLEGQVRVHQRETIIRGTGPRRWFYDDRWRLGAPEPVSEVEVSYTLAQGGRIIGHPDGETDPANPIGSGIIHPDFTPRHLDFAAPQLEHPQDPIIEDLSHPGRAVGFGPIPPWWKRRLAFSGTYDKAWEDKVHPRLPADFDYRHYQVGGMDLVLDHYLAPGMEIATAGLRPGGEAFQFRLPDIAPVATFSYTDDRVVKARLHIDGLHLDLTGEEVSYDLTFRAWIWTCPQLFRVDLDVTTHAQAMDEGYPVSGLEGLIAA